MHLKTTTTLAIIVLILLASAGVPQVLADEMAAPQSTSLSISNASHIVLALENHTYYPNDIVRVYVHDSTGPLVSVVDPLNNTYSLPLTSINDTSFLGQYALNQSIIIGNYTVIATDSATGDSARDTFEVTTRTVAVTPTAVPDNSTIVQPSYYLYVNVSQADYLPGDKAVITLETNAGTPTVVVQDPAGNTAYPECKKADDNAFSATYRLDKAVVLGNYAVLAYVNENGTYSSAMTGFNVTMGKKPDKGMRIQYAAYDPVQKAVVLRANITTDAADTTVAVKSDPVVKGMAVKSVKVLDGSKASSKADKKVDVLIPVDSNSIESIIGQYGLNRNITKATTSVAVSPDGTDIHLSLNDKVDGSWYRLSAPIPAGYQVTKITREDGVEIINDVHIDRNTGQTISQDINWYVDNGTLYFYDDPINGYNIALQPPAAVNSLAVNVASGGQLSAIVYPFNQTDPDSTITANDHLGYSGDNGYANDIDADAGTKTAVRMYTSGGSLIMFGNPGSSYQTYNGNGASFTDLTQPITVGFNTVPDGSVESVVISNYRTPSVTGAPSWVNITQKTIIRNNNLWFATVYYINNAGTADIPNFRFYQGADFNFNGQYTLDNDYYNAASDMVYGYMANSNPGSVHVGGYRSILTSSAHDVAQYGTVWGNIAADRPGGGTSTSNTDAGMALAWDRGTLPKGETWVVPVIWAVGSDTTGFTGTLNNAIGHSIYDVGIKSIDTPKSGDSLDGSASSIVTINATAMDVGVTDQSPAVVLQVKNSNGQVIYTATKTAQLSVPYQETAPVSFGWDISGVAPGTYTINVNTQLSGDQNSSNDAKSITVYVRDFSLYPGQWGHVIPGDNIFYTMTMQNLGTDRTFDLAASPSTAQWPTYLYYKDNTILLATDDDGDGAWDWVNDGYQDTNGQPCIVIPSGKTDTILVQKLIPTTADSAVLDTTVLTMSPKNQPSAISSATLKTDTPIPALAGKTFYMHAKTLNTTPETVASQSMPVTAVFAMWSQTPAFADNFNVSGPITVPLYYSTSSGTGTLPITVTLFYSNGAGNSVLVGSTTASIPISTSITSYNFVINPAGGSITIPKGSYLILKIDNIQTTTLNVYYDSTHRTCIQVNTPTYVHVSTINTYAGTTSTTSFKRGDSLHVTANVNDPIGAYDIQSACITITSPTGTAIVNNQTMTGTVTDPSSPPLWKTFDYPAFTLSNSLPVGVYTIAVTGYESNGVTHTMTTQITLLSTTAAVLVAPSNTKYTAPNTVWAFKHTVTNLNANKNDVVDISYTVSIPGWTVKLYKADGVTLLTDTDGDGVPDTGSIDPMDKADIVVQVTVPSYANPADIDTVNVTARSSNDKTVSSISSDTLLITSDSVTKTLYLHRTTALGNYLDTSPVSSAITQVSVPANTNVTWSQSPVFARSFNILDDPGTTLYLYNPGSKQQTFNIAATLKYTNGGTTTPIGYWSGSVVIGRRSTVTQNFNIHLFNPNTNIPAGSKLILDIRSDRTVTVYHSSTQPSRIDMDTQSYINVQSVSITDSSGNAITSSTPPANVKVFANITDPFGSYDITGASLSVQDSNGNPISGLGPFTMNPVGVDTGNPSVWKKYQYNLTLPSSLDTGNYNFVVTATESNGVIHKAGTQLYILYPINVTASKSITPNDANSYLITLKVTNNDASHTVSGVHAYDFYSSSFTESGFNCPRTSTPVNNAMLQGYINTFGPFSLAPHETFVITYTAQGSGDYHLSDMTIVGVDPYL